MVLLQYLLPREMRTSAENTPAVLQTPQIVPHDILCACVRVFVCVCVCAIEGARETARVRESESGCFFARVRESERACFLEVCIYESHGSESKENARFRSKGCAERGSEGDTGQKSYIFLAFCLGQSRFLTSSCNWRHEIISRL
jgi:hypothetical protein